jgi:3-oxoacyl-[acyl-carrier protein] reductase
MVTGASRGIGEAIAKTLARDGAHVIGLDIPALADDLRVVTSLIGGSALALDITAADCSRRKLPST